MRYGIALTMIMTTIFSPVFSLESRAADQTPRQMTLEVAGMSMTPFGFSPGDRVSVIATEAHVGDTIVFSCYHPQCHGFYIKKLLRKRNDCYWVEGRRDIWRDTAGRQKQSIDSVTTFGWLCGDMITIYGVVV